MNCIHQCLVLYIQYICSFQLTPTKYCMQSIKEVSEPEIVTIYGKVTRTYCSYVFYNTNKFKTIDKNYYESHDYIETAKKDDDDCFQLIYVESSINNNDNTTTYKSFLELILPEKISEDGKQYEMLYIGYMKLDDICKELKDEESFKSLMCTVINVTKHLLKYLGVKIMDYSCKDDMDGNDCVILRQHLKREYIKRYINIESEFMGKIPHQVSKYINIQKSITDTKQIDNEKKELYTLLADFIFECYKLNDEINNTVNSRIYGKCFKNLIDENSIDKCLLKEDFLDKYHSEQAKNSGKYFTKEEMLFYGSITASAAFLVCLIIYFNKRSKK